MTTRAWGRAPIVRDLMQAPTVDSEFIRVRTTDVVLDGGTTICVRPIVPDDRQGIAEGLARLSDETRYSRFFRSVDRLSERELTYLTEIDYRDHFAWVATSKETPPSGLGVARYIRSQDEPTIAEASVVVVDAYQGKGIARVLLELLSGTALEHGVTAFRSYALPSNRAVIDSMYKAGTSVTLNDEEGFVRLDVELPAVTGLRDSAMYEVLRAAATGAISLDRQ